MKLLAVNMTLDAATGGGTAVRTRHVMRALTDQGLRCTVLTTHDAGSAPVEIPAVEVISIPARGGRFRVPMGESAVRAAVEAADVVMLMNHWTAINLVAARAAATARRPWVVCPAGSLPVAGRSVLLKKAYNAWAGFRTIADAAGHIAITADERADFADYGVAPESVTVIPNGMPSLSIGNARTFRDTHGLADRRVALFIGRLAPIKGADLLVGAFAHARSALGDWTLVLAGPDDGARSSIEQQLNDLGLGDRVRLIGFLDEASKADALAAADLVVVPSRREAMSIVVLEAGAAGRPVLITDRCGVPDVASSQGGWVVDASVDGLAHGLAAAADAADRLDEYGRRWQRHATEHYSWERVGRLHRELFASVVEKARAR